jgi:hypothetical protein
VVVAERTMVRTKDAERLIDAPGAPSALLYSERRKRADGQRLRIRMSRVRREGAAALTRLAVFHPDRQAVPRWSGLRRRGVGMGAHVIGSRWCLLVRMQWTVGNVRRNLVNSTSECCKLVRRIMDAI